MENENGNPETGTGESGSAINPAWNDLLGAVPEEHHDQIIPHLQNWDRGVQDRFQKVQTEWADYGFLKENEITPDDTRIALGLLRAVQEDPENFYNSLGESYGFGAEKVDPNEGGSEVQGNEDLSNLPPEVMDRLSKLESQNNMMAEVLLAQKQREEQEQQDNALQTELAGLKTKHGNFNEKFVLSQMANGLSGEDAVKEYQGLVNEIKEQNARPPAPRLLGSNSGGIPGEKPIDPTKLSPAEAKNLVANYLKAHNAAPE